jgi:hypothetical protein
MTKQISVWYSRGEGEYRYEMTTHDAWVITDPDDHEHLAEKCADDFHSEHDGWEANWPLRITLYATKTGPAVATFEVEREYEPRFNAMKVDPA